MILSLLIVAAVPCCSWRAKIAGVWSYREIGLLEWNWLAGLAFVGLSIWLNWTARQSTVEWTSKSIVLPIVLVAGLGLIVAELLFVLPGVGRLQWRLHPTFIAGGLSVLLCCLTWPMQGLLRWGLRAGLIGVWLLSLVLLPPLGILHALQASTGVVYSLQTEQPVVYLTIDDAPSEHTDAIVEVLDRHEVRASFFIIGERGAGREQTLKTIVANGHGLGNHQWTARMGASLPATEFVAELIRTADLLDQLGGSEWVRPGNGFYTDQMLKSINGLGDRCILGNCFPWDCYHNWRSFSARYILRRAAPGSVIVLHDGESTGENTVAVLELVLPELKRRGYQIERLPADPLCLERGL